MKLSTKMICLFSAIMLIATFLLFTLTQSLTREGSKTFTSMRFANMSSNITSDIEQEINMMNMTLSDLTENLGFMASLNQIYRDDSPDRRLGLAAEKAALQAIYQSVLVDQYYSVNFITTKGTYFSSIPDKDGMAKGTEAILEIINITEELFAANPDSPYQILTPHPDLLHTRGEQMIYGVVQQVFYRGTLIGYISLHNECSSLSQVMRFVDNEDLINIQFTFDNNNTLFNNRETNVDFPQDLVEGELTTWTDDSTDITYEVYHSYIPQFGLHLYVSQNRQNTIDSTIDMALGTFKRMLPILLAALVLITYVSIRMTRSIHLLTKRVRELNTETMLYTSPDSLQETVTSPTDKEMHLLELSYNDMLKRLQLSAQSELVLRESALHAQMNALQTQINPHFIYNTLNIISAKAMELGNFDIIEICDQFASMLRYSTDTRSQTATMSNELDNVHDYLQLAKARYEDNLEFTISVPDELKSIEVPRLTLQPLVENALNHGFDGKNVLRKIYITGSIDQDHLILEIRDNGNGFSDDMLKNLQNQLSAIYEGQSAIDKELAGRIGLINTCLRLYYYSKGTIRVSISNDNGAVISLMIPVQSK